MSTEQVTSGDNSEASGQVDKKDAVTYESHQKLLGEKKKASGEVADLKKQLQEIEQSRLEEQGKIKEVNESLKKQLAEVTQAAKKQAQAHGLRTIKSQFDVEARIAGCLDPEELFKLVDLERLDIADDFTVTSDQLKSLISEKQKSIPFFFKKDVVPAKDATPNGKDAVKRVEGNLSGLKFNELQQMLAQKLAKG